MSVTFAEGLGDHSSDVRTNECVNVANGRVDSYKDCCQASNHLDYTVQVRVLVEVFDAFSTNPSEPQGCF